MYLCRNCYMKKLLPLLLIAVISSCQQKEYNADLLVKNGLIYTVDAKFDMADAFVVKGGKIVAVGKADSLEKIYYAKKVVDADGKAVYPGFIDAHAHFYQYGLSLQAADLVGTNSWT